jgi:toxin ParE1/3/4
MDGAFSVVDRLESYPASGRMVPEIEDAALREVIYKGYRIFHLVTGASGEESVEILAVVHSTRQSGGSGGFEPSVEQ